MKKIILALLILCANGFAQSDSLEDAMLSDNIFRHTKILASDSLQGRGTGTIGQKKAEKYIIDELQKIGVKPANKNSFLQSIPMLGSKALPTSEFKVYSISEHTLKLNDEYIVINSGTETFIPEAVDLVFAGFGITAPEYDYDDYFEIDVEGKMVLVFSDEPRSDDPKYFLGDEKSIYSSPDSKLRIALSKGALGVIIIPIEKTDSQFNWEYEKTAYQFEEIYLSSRMSAGFGAIINPEIVRYFLEGSGVNSESLLGLLETNSVRSFYLPAKVQFKGQFTSREFLSHNILGWVGSENNESWIVLSAHYDHLGVGNSVKGDTIYNGLNDNALGVAVLLEIVSKLKTIETRLKRNILLLFITGEEKGLLGSAFYIQNPIVPLSKTILNINIDGVPFIDRYKSIEYIDGQNTNIGSYIKDFLKKSSLIVDEQPDFPQEKFKRSDQFSFIQAGVPSVLIQEGSKPFSKSVEEYNYLKRFYSEKIYHTPFDDLNQYINYDACADFANLITDFTIFMADNSTSPEIIKGSPYHFLFLRNREYKK
jgi:hypothetical protein